MDALGTSSKETTTRMPEKIEVLYYVDEKLEAVSRRTAEYTVERILAATTARGKARIAISGGHTPKHTFELLADTSLRLLPVTPEEVKRMLGELRGAPLLRGARGTRPADLDREVHALAAGLSYGPACPFWVFPVVMAGVQAQLRRTVQLLPTG